MCLKMVFRERVFFFKQKTAYEMLRSLVGSEMCIRDRILLCPSIRLMVSIGTPSSRVIRLANAVSYTHLTLPTILRVQLSGVAFSFQAEDGIRDAQESRGLGDVYKRQDIAVPQHPADGFYRHAFFEGNQAGKRCLLYTSDAADDLTRTALGGRLFFSSRRRHTRCSGVSWARRCV